MTKKNSKSKYMSEYEHDLTWMATRYAIGRHTIAAHCICCEMAKNIYGRLSEDKCKFQAKDIRKEIASHLQFYPFNFTMAWNVSTDSQEYKPMARFIEWMDDNNIVTPEDLTIWKEIVYKGINLEGHPEYIATQVDGNPHYCTSDFIDMLEWENLSNLLDTDSHKFCLVNNDGKLQFVEYFDTYSRVSYKTLEFEKIKVPVESYRTNAHVQTRLIEDNIIKDNMTYEMMLKEYDKIVKTNKDIELPKVEYKE